MWLIKLPFRMIAMLFLAVIAVLSIFYKLFLNLSSLAAGLGFLLFGIGLLMAVLEQSWLNAAIIIVMSVLIFLALMFAELISMGLDAMMNKVTVFIFS